MVFTLQGIRKEFCKRLKEIRKKRQETQQELADNTGLSRSTIASYETGASIPDIEIAAILAAHLEVSVDYLIGIENNTTHDLKFICDKTGLSEISVKRLMHYKSNEAAYGEDLLGLDTLITYNEIERALKGLGRCINTPVLHINDFDDLSLSCKYFMDSDNAFHISALTYDKDPSGSEANYTIQMAELLEFQFRHALDITIDKILHSRKFKENAINTYKEKYKDNE